MIAVSAERVAGVEVHPMRSVLREAGRAEDVTIALALSAMVLLPVVEIVLRRTLHAGIQGAPLIVQHLALIVGMLGGAIAAREGRMLALSTLGDSFLRGTGQRIARATAGAVGGTVAAFL